MITYDFHLGLNFENVSLIYNLVNIVSKCAAAGEKPADSNTVTCR